MGAAELCEETIAELNRTIPADFWCWSLVDPDSLLHWAFALQPAATTLRSDVKGWHMAIEQHESTLSRHAIGRAREPVATLTRATAGERSRSLKWLGFWRPHGVGDVAIWACRDAHGCWGCLEALRADDCQAFSDEDAALLSPLSGAFGTALRTRAGGVTPAVERRPPGMLVLDDDLRLASWTPSVPGWLTALPERSPLTTMGLLPSVIYAVAGRVTAPASIARLGYRLRLRTDSGSWAVLEGAPLEGEHRGRVAVTIRAAEPREVADLLCRVHALTARERQLAALVAVGLSTRAIAAQLHLSSYTVKDHLKAIFAKTGVNSRVQLAAMLAGGAPVAAQPEPAPIWGN
jgi:DNA-binding CsgD family transcriptional regulator